MMQGLMTRDFAKDYIEVRLVQWAYSSDEARWQAVVRHPETGRRYGGRMSDFRWRAVRSGHRLAASLGWPTPKQMAIVDGEPICTNRPGQPPGLVGPINPDAELPLNWGPYHHERIRRDRIKQHMKRWLKENA